MQVYRENELVVARTTAWHLHLQTAARFLNRMKPAHNPVQIGLQILCSEWAAQTYALTTDSYTAGQRSLPALTAIRLIAKTGIWSASAIASGIPSLSVKSRMPTPSL